VWRDSAARATVADVTPHRTEELSRALLGGLLVVALLVPEALRTAGPALLALAAVAGVPHGAADLALMGGVAGGRRRWLLLVLGYAGVAAASVTVALAVPGLAVAALLALAVAHFAEGETALRRLAAPETSAAPGLAVAAVVVLVPLARWPGEVGPVLAGLSPGLADAVTGGPGRSGLALAAGACVLAGLLRGDRTGRAEVVLVLAAALVVPPLALFAVWFAGWHALRHLARVGASRPLGPVLRLAAAPSVVALVAVVALTPTLGSVPAAVLLVLLALTVPHAVVVAGALRPSAVDGPDDLLSATGTPARPAG
jgi:beta-carotene 15,15'-dioxygenase